MKESDFIGQMVQETIKIAEQAEHNVLDFSLDVDRTIHLQYHEVRMCHILTNKKATLEIPQNWGPFKNRITHEIYVCASDDKYEFLAMLNQFLGENFKSVKLVTAPMVQNFCGNKAA